MLLRRVTEHIKTQNWFAVALDLIIVVFGVFLGVQAVEWQAERQIEKDFSEIRSLFIEETHNNIEKIKALQIELAENLPLVSKGVEALLACDDSEGAESVINKALKTAVITRGLKIEREVLDSIVSSEAFLARADRLERQRLKDFAAFLKLMQTEIDFMELEPFSHLYWVAPSVTFTDLKNSQVNYAGMDMKLSMRNPILNVPVDQACQDNQLVKGLRVWEHLQLVLPTYSQMVHQAMINNLSALEVKSL